MVQELTFLEQLCDIAVISGKVKNEIPLSLLIIAEPEAGKTLTLQKYQHYPSVVYRTDVTEWGLTKWIIKDIQSGKYTHILIPDLIRITSKSKKQVQNLISYLLGLLNDGTVSISTIYQEDNYTGLRCGLITAITPKAYAFRKKYWAEIGFLSRCLPITYSYSKETTEKILNFTLKGEYLNFKSNPLKIPKLTDIKLSNEIAIKLKEPVSAIAQAEKEYGFRKARQFRVMLKANALLHNRKEVTTQDLNEVQKLIAWINLDYKQI